MKMIQLNNGLKMPLKGLGVFQVTDNNICEQAVLQALNIGYRVIDTAACYGNEAFVGSAIEKIFCQDIREFKDRLH